MADLKKSSSSKKEKYEGKKHIISNDQATVKVIVKLKDKRRGDKKDYNRDEPDKIRGRQSGYADSDMKLPSVRTGSWADLLSKKSSCNKLNEKGDFVEVRTERKLNSKPSLPTQDSEALIWKHRCSKAEKENRHLRSELARCKEDLENARANGSENLVTIKELFQLADFLKNENQQLLSIQRDQRFLQEKCSKAMEENQQLRQHLNTLLVPSDVPQSKSNDEQMNSFKYTIRDVRKTIAEEIEGIRSGRGSFLSQSHATSPVVDFDSEVERLVENKNDKSSTQYLHFGKTNSPNLRLSTPIPKTFQLAAEIDNGSSFNSSLSSTIAPK